MEYVDGGNVKNAIKKTGSIPVDEAGRIILQAARALSYAHEQNVIHRDVKPDNLMLTREGTVKLADLGIARTFEEPTAKGENSARWPDHTPPFGGVEPCLHGVLGPRQSHWLAPDAREDRQTLRGLFSFSRRIHSPALCATSGL